MRKIIVSTMMSLDGVEDNPQNWSFDYWNDEIGKYASDLLFATDAPGQDILQYGCGELTYTMIEAGLVDELRLLVYPVTVGTGARIFENIAKTPMKLLSSQAFSTGVIAQHYQPVKS